MARPQTLPDDIAAVKAAGVDTIMSLLEPAEAAKIGLAAQEAACSAQGIAFLNHPIRDMHLPEATAFAALAADVAARLRNGSNIALHCYASIGRSGMLACTILGHFGYTSQTALSHVSQMRGKPVPDTEEQAAFIKQIMSPPNS
jgi:protein-tyrosine phosphatase